MPYSFNTQFRIWYLKSVDEFNVCTNLRPPSKVEAVEEFPCSDYIPWPTNHRLLHCIPYLKTNETYSSGKYILEEFKYYKQKQNNLLGF
jgi:hypothetical protein